MLVDFIKWISNRRNSVIYRGYGNERKALQRQWRKVMGREATKAQDNPWYQARKKAAIQNKKLESREGAAELLNMSVSAVSDAELDLTKIMPAAKAVLMADLYHAPHLLNYYCLHECPIGCRHPISDQVLSIERASFKVIKYLNEKKISNIKEKLIDLTYDGEISEDEQEEMEEVVRYLEELSKAVCELKVAVEES